MIKLFFYYFIGFIVFTLVTMLLNEEKILSSIFKGLGGVGITFIINIFTGVNRWILKK